MKRSIALMLVVSLIFSLVGCGGEAAKETPDPTQSSGTTISETQPSDQGGPVEVDEHLLTVDMVIPASLFDEDMSSFDADAYAKENGFNSAKVNEDGSVSVNMSKSKHKELMSEMRTTVEDAFQELIGAEETPYIIEIEHSDSFDIVDIIVDKSGYEAGGLATAFLPLVVYSAVGGYQIFDGVETPRCEISMIAAGTNEVLDCVIYPDVLEGLGDHGSDTVFDETVYTTEEIVVVDNEVCTMKISNIDPNGDWGFTFHVFCENKTNTTLEFYMDYVSVNGFMCDSYWGTEIPGGKKENSSFEISTSTLDELGISVVEEVMFDLTVGKADDWSADPYIEETFSIYPTGLSAGEVSYTERVPVPGEVICVDNEDCTFIVLSADPEGDWGYTLRCYLENKTDQYLGFYWDEVSVNGFMIDPYWSTIIAPGKRGYSEVSFSEEDLANNGIETITDIEYTLQVSDADDWYADPFINTTFVYKPGN